MSEAVLVTFSLIITGLAQALAQRCLCLLPHQYWFGASISAAVLVTFTP